MTVNDRKNKRDAQVDTERTGTEKKIERKRKAEKERETRTKRGTEKHKWIKGDRELETYIYIIYR